MKSIKILSEVLFITLVGTMLHFLYDITGGSVLTAWISGVNESTFEHLKLFYWAVVMLTAAEYFATRKNGKSTGYGFFTLRLVGMLLGMAFITVFFYTYQGITGRNYDVVNIIDFVFGAVVFSLWVNCKKISRQAFEGASVATFAALGVLFVVFTFAPPHIGLFRDPVGGGYGIL